MSRQLGAAVGEQGRSPERTAERRIADGGPRGRTVFRELRARGASVRVAAEVAAQTRRWWWNACHRVHLILRNPHFEDLGLPRLAK